MDFLTVNETARMLRVSPITVRRYIASGRLAAERVGRGIRVRREAIEEFVMPVVPSSAQPDADKEDPPTLRESLGNVIGIGRSGEPTNIAEHKDEYIADAIADWYGEEDNENLVEVVSPSSPGGVESVPVRQLIGKPTTEDDPLWNIVGIGRSGEPARDAVHTEDEDLVEIYSASSPGGVEFVPNHLLGKPFT